MAFWPSVSCIFLSDSLIKKCPKLDKISYSSTSAHLLYIACSSSPAADNGVLNNLYALWYYRGLASFLIDSRIKHRWHSLDDETIQMFNFNQGYIFNIMHIFKSNIMQAQVQYFVITIGLSQLSIHHCYTI